MRKATYSLGRVQKIGDLTHDDIIQSMKVPREFTHGGSVWQFTDYLDGQFDPDEAGESAQWYSARLAKYSTKGPVEVVDPSGNRITTTDVANKLITSSRFIYLPEFSGIIVQRIAQHIEFDRFAQVFPRLIYSSEDKIFAAASIAPVSEFERFWKRVAQFERIFQITATVKPPNPLYGHLWKSLKDYLKDRNASSLKVDERSESNSGLASDLIKLAKNASEDGNLGEQEKPLALVDAAMVMCTDGYGIGTSRGVVAGESVTVSTATEAQQLQVPALTEASVLARQARSTFQAINEKRGLGH